MSPPTIIVNVDKCTVNLGSDLGLLRHVLQRHPQQAQTPNTTGGEQQTAATPFVNYLEGLGRQRKSRLNRSETLQHASVPPRHTAPPTLRYVSTDTRPGEQQPASAGSQTQDLPGAASQNHDPRNPRHPGRSTQTYAPRTSAANVQRDKTFVIKNDTPPPPRPPKRLMCSYGSGNSRGRPVYSPEAVRWFLEYWEYLLLSYKRGHIPRLSYGEASRMIYNESVAAGSDMRNKRVFEAYRLGHKEDFDDVELRVLGRPFLEWKKERMLGRKDS
ncbi:hypothetical protein EXIGLDRAFT_836276 [Exidia glandulosa HHB12029]|uniref:Uncharacterized protein n=1 Tax=Exidia glandulosa HHB12029 TaxID=1314781 RepID=A0A165HZ84_EXIGL|nr:hypothetical protein EXIGLDRAFT_836276 [Exidia glandulosa HHB12029]